MVKGGSGGEGWITIGAVMSSERELFPLSEEGIAWTAYRYGRLCRGGGDGGL